ncbi:MAG: hypothetical protein Q4C49_00585 [Bacillota bacterium]|nr:hypothetical protein [Bacillota bacterium]
MFVSSIKLPDGTYLDPGFLQRLVLAIKDCCENQGFTIADKFNFIFDQTVSDLDRVTLLINACKEINILQEQIGNDMELSAFLNALSKYSDAISKYTSENPSYSQTDWKDAQEFENSHNVLSALFDALKNKQAMTYASTLADGSLDIKSAVQHNKSKKTIREALKNQIQQRLNEGRAYFYMPEFQVTSDGSWDTLTSIQSPRIQQMLTLITGLNFSDSRIQKLYESPEGMISLRNFLKALTSAVQTQLQASGVRLHEDINANYAEAIVNDLVSGTHKQAFKVFSDAYIGQNSNLAEKLVNESNDTIPLEGSNNTISNLRGNMLRTAEQIPGITASKTGNLLWEVGSDRGKEIGIIQKSRDGNKRSNYTAHIVQSLDAVISDNVYKPTDLSVPELASIAMGTDYLYSIVKQGQMLTQIECFSDKVRIAKGAWNFSHVPMHRMSIEDIRKRAFEQHKTYFKAIESQICQDLNALFEDELIQFGKSELRTIVDANDFLEKWSTKLLKDNEGTYTESKNDFVDHAFARKVADYQAKHPDSQISFYRDIHYTFKKKAGVVGINSCLQYRIRQAQADGYSIFAKARATGLASLKKDLSNPKYMPGLSNTLLKSMSDILAVESTSNELLDLVALFGYDYASSKLTDSQKNSIKDNLTQLFASPSALFTYEVDDNTGEVVPSDSTIQPVDRVNKAKAFRNQLRDNFISKYFELFNITRDADLQVALKYMWIHDKDSSNLTGTLDFNDDAVIGKILKEESVRLTKGKKRMNSGPATYSSWAQGKTFGVPAKFRIATIEHAQLNSFNHFGNEELLNTHDGAILSSGVTRTLERGSYPGHQVASSLKIIAINQ